MAEDCGKLFFVHTFSVNGCFLHLVKLLTESRVELRNLLLIVLAEAGLLLLNDFVYFLQEACLMMLHSFIRLRKNLAHELW